MRPRKWRRVRGLPKRGHFGPLNCPHDLEPVIMTVDEYETIRLIDYEGMTQEECAVSMEVARSTVQGMYATARRKLADALVDGRPLRIEGGDYKIYDEDDLQCEGERCHRRRYRGRRHE